jgi:multicomponent K+:H+ antiporter subunit D
MNHWIVFPILIPAIMAPLLVLTSRFDQVLARIFSTSATVLMLIVAAVLYYMAVDGDVLRYEMGKWPSPFGIVFVLDRLSATMLLLSSLVSVAVALASMDGWDERGRHFHALLLMHLGGINGAFLTGDLFNLFVYFEVMLIGAYGLMVHGGGPTRLRAGIQFVVMNLCGSTIFLIALGLIYGATGGLQMADVGQLLAQMPTANRAVMSCGMALLVLVFAMKAALVPLHFWLPTAYGHAPPLVAAVFAISTKVGIYCLIRVHSEVIEGNQHLLSEWVTKWLVPAGLLTTATGMIGVLASRALGQMASYATLASTGTIMACVCFFDSQTLSGGMYYLVHSTLAGATLFLVVDAIASRRGLQSDWLVVSQPIAHAALVGGLFFVAAIGVTGLPPLSGFVGKLLVLDSVRNTPWAGWIWSVVLSTSLLGILGFARAGSTLFWKSATVESKECESGKATSTVMTLVASGLLVCLLLALTTSAGHTLAQLQATASQIWESE